MQSVVHKNLIGWRTALWAVNQESAQRSEWVPELGRSRLLSIHVRVYDGFRARGVVERPWLSAANRFAWGAVWGASEGRRRTPQTRW